jgi:hypothetical protein
MRRFLVSCWLFLSLFPIEVARSQGVRVGANCRDGTTSSATGSGACSQHGGVESWRYAEGPKEASPPVKEESKSRPALSTASSVKVWVNRNSGVYHCSGSHYYGTTKSGYYATESEAVASGKRPAYGKKCL